MRIGCVLRDLVKGEMKIMLRYMEHEERARSSGSLGFNQRRNSYGKPPLQILFLVSFVNRLALERESN